MKHPEDKKTKELPLRKYQKIFKNKSLTKQSFKNECDINNIMKQYSNTGTFPNVNQREPIYDDFENNLDYHAAFNFVMDAQKSFYNLPSKLRSEFDNDPAKFLLFTNDPENIPKMKELGILPQEQVLTLPPEAPEEPQKKETLLSKVLPKGDENSPKTE
jgi:phage internal scaffolding protein